MPAPISGRYFIPLWRQAPMLRVFVLLALGIVAGNQWHWILADGIPALIGGAILLAVACFVVAKRKRLLASLLLSIAIIIAGCLLVIAADISKRPGFIGHHADKARYWVLTLSEPILEKENSFKAEATAALIDSLNHRIPVEGRMILYFQKGAKAKALRYGSTLLMAKKPQPITNGGNPGGFDYKTYAGRQGLYYQVYLRNHEFVQLPETGGHAFQAWIYQMRQQVISIISRYIPPLRERGLAHALLIGYRGDLDKSLVEQYSKSGVVHIIAISGMHLGMIYGLLLFVFKPLGQNTAARIIRMALVLAIIWIFTLLTGAAPSITRAAAMFSFLALAPLFRRGISIYNSLATAAVVLLVANPYSLWNVGFQLSFTAVLSIAVFYAPINRWISSRYKMVQYIWSLLAVSLAAQLLTLPLVVYHFHQFPVYFLLANLLAVPLSALALYAILLMLSLAWWPAVAAAIGQGVAWLLFFLNESIIWVNRLPFTAIEFIQLSILQAVLLYGLISFGAWWLMHRKPAGLVGGVFCLAALGVAATIHQVENNQRNMLVVYNIPGYTGVERINGTRSWFMGHQELTTKGFLQNFHLLPTRIYWQFTPAKYQPLPADSNLLIGFGRQKMLILQKQIDYKASGQLACDWLLVTGSARGNPARILQHIQPGHIVLDATTRLSQRARWQAAADSLHLRLHNTPDEGAFLIQL